MRVCQCGYPADGVVTVAWIVVTAIVGLTLLASVLLFKERARELDLQIANALDPYAGPDVSDWSRDTWWSENCE